jgi:hypothetical protein
MRIEKCFPQARDDTGEATRNHYHYTTTRTAFYAELKFLSSTVNPQKQNKLLWVPQHIYTIHTWFSSVQYLRIGKSKMRNLSPRHWQKLRINPATHPVCQITDCPLTLKATLLKTDKKRKFSISGFQNERAQGHGDFVWGLEVSLQRVIQCWNYLISLTKLFYFTS